MAKNKVIGIVLSMKDQFTAPAKKITASTKNINKEMRRTEKQLQNVGKSVVKFAKIGVATLGAVGVASTKMAMDFSKGQAKISTLVDTNQVNMKQMGKDIIKLSNETGIAVGLLQEDVYNAISAGVDASKAVATVASSSKLAKAGFAESGQSLDLLTTIVNAYGMSLDEVDKISDILINTQNKGKTTVGEMSATMGKIIPTANSVGVQLEQVASGYAIMTANGIATAESTTYMNSMLNELGKNGTKASKELQKATGKSFQQLIKEGKTVGDVLAIMDKQAKKSGLGMGDMFGSAEAAKAALILSKNAGEDFNDMLKDMQSSTGATQEAFDKLDTEPIEKLQKSFNRMKNAGIELGVRLLPIVNYLMDGLLKLTEVPIAPYLDSGLNKAKATLGFFKENWGTIAPIVGTITAGFIAYKTAMIAQLAWTKAVTIASAIKTGVLATGVTTVNLMTIAQWALNAAMTANPIGLVIAGLTALVAVGVLVYKNFDKIKTKVLDIWDRFQPFKDLAIMIFMPWLKPLQMVWKQLDKVFGLGEKIEKLKFWKKDKKGNTQADSMAIDTDLEYATMDKFAKGGIATKPSVFGEAGAEIAIPLKQTKRSKKLLAQANEIIGGSSGGEVTINNTNTQDNRNMGKTEHKSEQQVIFHIHGNVYGLDDLTDKVGKAITKKIKTKIPVVV